ncbi:hypothetical protein [Mucilaginibacter sp. L196]|nr:hypothetical protein [Mucilaginibacter sp. L196]
MKINTHSICQMVNTVRKSNGIKPYLWYITMNVTYFISKLMRILNY